MSFSVYEITVPLMVQGLTVLDDYLNHTQALERERGMEPGEALEASLAPDKLSLGEQFSVSCNKVGAHLAKLLHRERPTPRAPAMMYPALKGRLIPTALKIDCCPFSGPDGANAIWVVGEPVPSLTARIEDVVIAVPCARGEFARKYSQTFSMELSSGE